MSVHIEAKVGDIAETILLPGDPLRAKFIADTYLEDVVCYNQVRGMLGFTGTYKGKRISVQGSGMGIPSFAIYANELISEYGVKNLIRVGTCGGMQESVRVRDVILAQAACTDSSMNRNTFPGFDFAPIASFGLLKEAYERAVEKGLNVHVGNILSSDIFYRDDKTVTTKLMQHGVLGVEMETTALYSLAAKFGVNALTILTVSDHLLTGEETTSAERQSTFNDMMEVALETALTL
ncbi:purine-nucleoside phosphorylase [Saccharibacillus kuerlensis]|uniref:Purine nucleoside phosphorylase DeoD-type n=1 Tax=Saccharibacillus kuerlensis TaxID=459527 RepID=A0ABQ2L768_9BACL|nr:purine-nucleoside phosphorylase [Saccharibacillus kuerlensis]GGO05515.1 purine nucleoside phosphorylase DeoD-type [Saccharibacillus kuerlensis]